MFKSVLIVVPTLNEVRTIGPVIDGLLSDLPAALDVRLVVADGGSSDGTRDLVRRIAADRRQVSLLANPARIQSAAVNLAVRQFGESVDVLIRCDAHAAYPKHFVACLLESLERTGAEAIVVPMDSVGETCLQRAIAWVSDTPIGSGGSAHRGGQRSAFVDHGHHAAFRMESFRRAGGYDETFTHNEDAELDCRQRAYGSRIYLDADIRLQYKPRDSLRALARQYFNYGRGRSRTVRLHPESLRARQLAVPACMTLALLGLLFAPLWPVALLVPGAYLAILAAMAAGLSLRHRSVCGLLAAPAAATMHGAWASGFIAGWIGTRERRWAASTVATTGAGDRG